jgi:hypothetical protein
MSKAASALQQRADTSAWSCRSKQLSGGETFNLSTCAAVQLSLSQPLDQYQIQVQQAPRDGAQEQRCELGAQLLEQEPTAEQVAACDTLALDLQGPGGAPAGMQRASHWLHLHSSCAGTAATLKVHDCANYNHSC